MTQALPARLGFTEVAALLGQADALASAPALDLAAVQRADSAGIALLLELTRRARRQGRALHLRNASQQLREMAAFFGVDSLLSFQ